MNDQSFLSILGMDPEGGLEKGESGGQAIFGEFLLHDRYWWGMFCKRYLLNNNHSVC